MAKIKKKKKKIINILHEILEKLSNFGEKGINEKNLLKDYTKKELEAVANLSAYNLNHTINLENRNGETIWSIHSRGYNLLWQAEQDRLNFKQIKIIQNQTEFTKILMLATVVLALGTFLTLVFKIIEFDWSKITSSIGTLLTIIFILLFFVLFCLMAFIIWKIIRVSLKR